MFDVEFRPHVGLQTTALGVTEITHPITQCWGEGQLLAYYFHESGHLSIIHSKLIPPQRAHLEKVVAEKFGVKNVTQARPLADAPSPEKVQEDQDGTDLEEAGL